MNNCKDGKFRKENGYNSMSDCVATILPPESDDGAEKSFEEKLGIEGKELKNPRPAGKKKNGNWPTSSQPRHETNRGRPFSRMQRLLMMPVLRCRQHLHPFVLALHLAATTRRTRSL